MEFLDSGKKLSSSIGLARYIAETYGKAVLAVLLKHTSEAMLGS